ncbi:uncharacterized protein LOC127266492 [Andrographis paniculata]|uniref:uncharacterized protein LOC127266492 n=1 Tax=Andrographis paniculata TaxID=175694 RepID=UPI0021E73AB0|nr:uncharacterized protein LOC127266492 [Andrographis paniculata]
MPRNERRRRNAKEKKKGEKKKGRKRFSRPIPIPTWVYVGGDLGEVIKIQKVSVGDVVGVLIDVAEQKQRNKRQQPTSSNIIGDRVQEIVIVTEELLPTRLTLWNELVDAEGKYFTSIVKERPIIAALHLKATLYAGISLSAISMANFIVDPPYPEADNLLSWKLNNKVCIDELVIKKPYFNTAEGSPLAVVTLSTIATMSQSTRQGEYKIKGCLSIKVDKKVQLHYNACDKCYTSTPAPTARQFFCLRCKSVQSSEQKLLIRQDQLPALFMTI